MEIEIKIEPLVLKRTLESIAEEAECDTYIHFFPHFKVPIQEWGVIDKLVDEAEDSKGLCYIHRETLKPLMIRLILGQIVTNYEVYFRQKEDVDKLAEPIRLSMDDNESDDDKCGKMIFTLAQLNEQYVAEGPIAKNEEEMLEYYDEFLTLLDLKAIPKPQHQDESQSSSKKCRVKKEDVEMF